MSLPKYHNLYLVSICRILASLYKHLENACENADHKWKEHNSNLLHNYLRLRVDFARTEQFTVCF